MPAILDLAGRILMINHLVGHGGIPTIPFTSYTGIGASDGEKVTSDHNTDA